jgi:hypothetical protein
MGLTCIGRGTEMYIGIKNMISPPHDNIWLKLLLLLILVKMRLGLNVLVAGSNTLNANLKPFISSYY